MSVIYEFRFLGTRGSKVCQWSGLLHRQSNKHDHSTCQHRFTVYVSILVYSMCQYWFTVTQYVSVLVYSYTVCVSIGLQLHSIIMSILVCSYTLCVNIGLELHSMCQNLFTDGRHIVFQLSFKLFFDFVSNSFSIMFQISFDAQKLIFK